MRPCQFEIVSISLSGKSDHQLDTSGTLGNTNQKVRISSEQLSNCKFAALGKGKLI